MDTDIGFTHKVNSNDIKDDFSINIDKNYLGKAGEYLTAGKLLLNGFNVFMGAYDDGIDIIASKNNNFYKIQVKTGQDIEGLDSGKFIASINLDTLAKHDPNKTFVVFVLHYLSLMQSLDNVGNHNFYDQNFIVLPTYKIFEFLKRKSGHTTIRILSGIGSNEGWIYKLKCSGQELLLDKHFLKSFTQIGN